MSTLEDWQNLFERLGKWMVDTNDSIKALSERVETETINRRRDTLDLLSTIAGVEERFANSINVLEERIDELEDRLANHVNVKEVSDEDRI